MRISTLDPITLKEVTELENAPYVINGEGHQALKIYFENESNKAKFLAIPPDHSDTGMSQTYAQWLSRRIREPSLSPTNNRQY